MALYLRRRLFRNAEFLGAACISTSGMLRSIYIYIFFFFFFFFLLVIILHFIIFFF